MRSFSLEAYFLASNEIDLELLPRVAKSTGGLHLDNLQNRTQSKVLENGHFEWCFGNNGNPIRSTSETLNPKFIPESVSELQ